ncbi:MAG TPA: RNA pseudouridine synthase [Holosporales bacterium]|nr:RNA pseudouridine synthase [Holosporales bacterium]
MSEQHHIFYITPLKAGERLDKFLNVHLPDLTRTRLKALIESDQVLLGEAPHLKSSFCQEEGDEPCEDIALSADQIADVSMAACTQPSKKLKEMMVVSLTVPKVEEALPIPQKVDFEVVFEDADVIVINKPAGLVVHPGAGNHDGTLVNGLLYHCGDSLSGIGGVARPGIVHRLDKGTSGLMVVAKNDHAHQFLSNQFVDRTLKRTYFAICWGMPNPLEGTIKGNIARDPRHRQRMKVVGFGGKEAVTHYYTHEKLGHYCAFIECTLETGRTHQIRVHMTQKGNSLVGDPLYGRKPRGLAVALRDKIAELTLDGTRPILHAARLQFIHPTTKETLEFETELPQDFTEMYEYMKTV